MEICRSRSFADVAAFFSLEQHLVSDADVSLFEGFYVPHFFVSIQQIDQQYGIAVFHQIQIFPHVLSIYLGREANLLLFEVV